MSCQTKIKKIFKAFFFCNTKFTDTDYCGEILHQIIEEKARKTGWSRVKLAGELTQVFEFLSLINLRIEYVLIEVNNYMIN